MDSPAFGMRFCYRPAATASRPVTPGKAAPSFSRHTNVTAITRPSR
jgi:hypothetical protein